MADEIGNGNENGLGMLDRNEIYQAAAGVALIIAGASLLLANPENRQYVKEGLHAFFPNLDLEKLPDPLAMGLATVLPDLQKYMKMRSM